jgi:hypothetical protein
MIDKIHKYQNPDRRCTFPCDGTAEMYCWSFANHVDGTHGFEDMAKICPGCECWQPETATLSPKEV